MKLIVLNTILSSNAVQRDFNFKTSLSQGEKLIQKSGLNVVSHKMISCDTKTALENAIFDKKVLNFQKI